MKVLKLIRKDVYGHEIVEEYYIVKKEDQLKVKKVIYSVPYLQTEYDLPEMTFDEFVDYIMEMYKGEEKDLVYQLLSKLIY